MTNVDSQRIKEIRDNTQKMADAFTRIADALEKMANNKSELRSSQIIDAYCDREDTDCTLCFKESHCKALAKAERELK